MLVIKRNGVKKPFQRRKVRLAISKANLEVPTDEQASGKQIDEICSKIEGLDMKEIHVETIQDFIEKQLMTLGLLTLAKKYIIYRYNRMLTRKANTTDDSILSLVKNKNKGVMEENSNKNAFAASTQRDLIAGEVSKDLTWRMLLPKDIVEAHEQGVLHFHDADYFLQQIPNCCLIAIGDMLDNGTMLNGVLIETPKSFSVACNVMTQIIASVASNQYGGQSVAIKHLGKYLAISREKHRIKTIERWSRIGLKYTDEQLEKEVEELTHKELVDGVQTIQYQIITLMSSNGQSPFLTLFLQIDDNDPYVEEVAMVVEEIIKQRIQGVKNKKGVYVTPAFPKLVYVLDENNCLKGGKYDYITKLCAKCNVKRIYPDYISAKVMHELHEGQVYSPMGCVDGKEVIQYKIGDDYYTESFERMWGRLSIYNQVNLQNPLYRDSYIDLDNVSIWDSSLKSYVEVKRLIRNVSDSWLNLKFSNGRSIRVTEDHPFETINRGVVLAKDLLDTDKILVDKLSAKVEEVANICNTNEAWFLGMYKFHHDRGSKGKYTDVRARGNGGTSISIRKDLERCFEGVKKIDRHIPNFIFSSSEDVRLAFLCGLIDADGYIHDSRTVTTVELGSTNKELALQQMLLAQSLGFRARVYQNHYNKKDYSKIRYLVEFDADCRLDTYLVSEKKKEKLHDALRSNASNYSDDYCTLISRDSLKYEDYSYDVTTESEHFTVSGIYSHNCRSFLSEWKVTEEMKNSCNLPDNVGDYKFEGRFNQGVVSLNLPQVGLVANGDMDLFWEELEKRLALCFRALMCRHKALEGTLSNTSEIHWQNGAIARLKEGETIDKLLHDGYSTLSLGYIGLYETTVAMLGVSHTTPEGKEFAMKVLTRLKKATEDWKAETGLGFGLYGTPRQTWAA